MNPETKCNQYQGNVNPPFYHESLPQQQQGHLMQPQPYFQQQPQNSYQSQHQILPQAALPMDQLAAVSPQTPQHQLPRQYQPQAQQLVQGDPQNQFTLMQSTQSKHRISQEDTHQKPGHLVNAVKYQEPPQVQPLVHSLWQQTHVDSFATMQHTQLHQQNQLQVQKDDLQHVNRFNAQQSRIYNEKHRNYEAIMNRGKLF